jgi:hypothetical protein
MRTNSFHAFLDHFVLLALPPTRLDRAKFVLFRWVGVETGVGGDSFFNPHHGHRSCDYRARYVCRARMLGHRR